MVVSEIILPVNTAPEFISAFIDQSV
jgi:hypothetical protein